MTVNAHPGQRFSRDTSDERVVGAAHHGRYLPHWLWELPNPWALPTTCTSQLCIRTVGPHPLWRALPRVWPSGIKRHTEKTTLQQYVVEGS